MRTLFIILIFCSCTRKYYVTCNCPDSKAWVNDPGFFTPLGGLKETPQYYAPYYDRNMEWLLQAQKDLNEMKQLSKQHKKQKR